MSRSRLRGGAEAGRFKGGLPEKKLKEKGQGSGDMGGAGVGGSAERRTNKCSHRGGRPSKGSLQVRYLAEVGQLGASSRLADGVFPSDLPWTPSAPLPPHQKTKQKNPSPRQPSAELGGEEGEVGPCSASTLRLRLEKSPRVKHDLHQGRKKSIPPRGRWAGGGGGGL